MANRRLANIGGIAVAVVLVVGLGLSRVLGDAADAPASTCDDPIPWDEASAVVGESAAIAGPVAATNHEPEVGGAPTFLNLGAAHPNPERFDVVIYDDVRGEFDEPPEDAFDDEDVCVHGQVRDRDGVPQIILDGPAWIITR